MRKTLIFGNGLGMAVNPEFYSLDNTISKVWNDKKALDGNVKELIKNCLPEEKKECPRSEDDLDTLQLVVSSCDFLSSLKKGDKHWLSEHGRRFPSAVRKFIHTTAMQFHTDKYTLPQHFSNSLNTFIKKTKSHVATLNYDNLLYQPMIDAKILSGYGGSLVDGFYSNSTGFHAKHLEREKGNNFGYYMHLHGSPLFVGRNDNQIIKLRKNEKPIGDNDDCSDPDVLGSHIVLTHVKHKPTVIAASPLLQTYWDHLEKALKESKAGVILFGYSGLDIHLNKLLDRVISSKIKVIEWTGADSGKSEDNIQNIRENFWKNTLNKDVEVTRMKNILDFSEWND